jgi:tRNA(fMet)-specific endonuclease VapC
MQFILDTDHVSLILRGDSKIQTVIENIKVDIYTSIITAQELFKGWVVRINNAKPSDDLVKLYAEFHQSINYLKKRIFWDLMMLQILVLDNYYKRIHL